MLMLRLYEGGGWDNWEAVHGVLWKIAGRKPNSISFFFFPPQTTGQSCLLSNRDHAWCENLYPGKDLVVYPQCFWVIGLRPCTSWEEDDGSVSVYHSSASLNDMRGLVCRLECISPCHILEGFEKVWFADCTCTTTRREVCFQTLTLKYHFLLSIWAVVERGYCFLQLLCRTTLQVNEYLLE